MREHDLSQRRKLDMSFHKSMKAQEKRKDETLRQHELPKNNSFHQNITLRFIRINTIKVLINNYGNSVYITSLSFVNHMIKIWMDNVQPENPQQQLANHDWTL